MITGLAMATRQHPARARCTEASAIHRERRCGIGYSLRLCNTHAAPRQLDHDTAEPQPSPPAHRALSVISRTLTATSHSTDARRHYAHSLGLRGSAGLLSFSLQRRTLTLSMCHVLARPPAPRKDRALRTGRFSEPMRRNIAEWSRGRSREAAASPPTRLWSEAALCWVPLRRAGAGPEPFAECTLLRCACTM